jgi:two-component system NtrC family sensor kinase
MTEVLQPINIFSDLRRMLDRQDFFFVACPLQNLIRWAPRQVFHLFGRFLTMGSIMFYSFRSKIIASFLGVTFLVGAVSLLVGGHLLNKSVFGEARNRVSQDLNAAREMYESRVRMIEVSLNVTTLGYGFISSFRDGNTSDLVFRLGRMAQHAGLDFAGLTDEKGQVICHIGPHPIPAKASQSPNPIVAQALKTQTLVSGTVLLGEESLKFENPRLAERARIDIIQTPGVGPVTDKVVTSGLTLSAGVPIDQEGRLLGVLYGGILLNRDERIVDTVRGTVFRNEEYKGRSIGRATIFLKDVRVATNVPAPDGGRAIGTRVAEDVREHVLDKGERWTKQAMVVTEWYITAYEPIKDIFDKTVGILGMGVLEEKYADLRWRTLASFVLITLAGMALATLLGCFLAGKIIHPVRRLILASQQVTEGSLTPDIGPVSSGEMAVLQKTFKEMVAAMGRRRAESQDRLVLSERQASVGRLAAGVAHEINNPLTGVLTYTHMLLRRKDLNEDVRADLQTIAEATERVRKIVKGLLDFSRQTKLDREQVDVNRLISSTIALMENQALVKGISIVLKPGNDLRLVNMDRNQFQSVLLNILINALDATKPGDSITLSTSNSPVVNEAGQQGIEISIADTGCGIPPEHLNKLFDPFFTTKEVGHGTGLGLAVTLGIVQRHGGTISVDSEVGKGTTFTIWVPLEGRVK